MARLKHRDRVIAFLARKASIEHMATEEDIRPEDGFERDDDVRTVRELARRTMWGWCCVKTTAEYAGYQGTTYLGCCSYESADHFVEDNGQAQAYEACAALLDNMMAAIERGDGARKALRAIRALTEGK